MFGIGVVEIVAILVGVTIGVGVIAAQDRERKRAMDAAFYAAWNILAETEGTIAHGLRYGLPLWKQETEDEASQ